MTRFFKHSISNKLMLVIMSTTFIAVVVYATVMLAYDLRAYHRTIVQDVTTQAKIIAEVSIVALEFGDAATAKENLALLRTRPIILRAALFTPDNLRFADYTSQQSQQLIWPEVAQRTAQYHIDKQRIEVWQPLMKDGELLGSVYIRARYDVTTRLIESVMILVGVMGASLGLALLIAIWLRSAVTTPILAVTDVARNIIQSRDFSLRAKKQTEDEVGVLVEAFNDMLEEIERRNVALQKSNLSLGYEMEERHAAELALRMADRRKDEFLATLAHELRNPLAPLVNGLQILRQSENDVATSKTTVAIMERQLEQMVRLVDDLLDVSRITTGKLKINKSRAEAQSIMRTAVETSGGFIESCGHTLVVEMPSEPIYIDADSLRLAQVLSNLLNNAAKYTDRGGSIIFRGYVVDDLLTFSIKDNGIGISPDMLNNIFNMFTQVDQSLERKVSGLGVGLALSKHLVELHGGKLFASSDGPGRGSTFSVCLNIPSQVAQDSPSRLDVKKAALERHRRRVLLVDDNVDFVTTMATLLTTLGHEVRVVHDGPSALLLVQEFVPEFAFLDIGMPGMNGHDLAGHLRQIPTMASCVLTAVTGWGQEKDRQLSKSAGFDYHLVKPVNLDAILEIIEKSPNA